MRFGELFAGAGGLSLGLERAGLTCAWHAEIAPDPRVVLKARWPHVPLYEDVTELDGRALVVTHGPIDLLSGGSPCQDLSVAGRRAGLEGSRSSLFYEQMRLWDETGADLCLWENVDGARSSNAGKDFGEVLRAFVGAAVAVPADGWRSAGVAAGPAGVAAWRVLDAQFFGVPQRRRRVFVLGTRTGRVDPAEILSLTDSVRGDSAPGRAPREELADDAGEGAESSGSLTPWDGQAQRLFAADGVFPALSARERSGLNRQAVVAINAPRRLTPRECERLMDWPDDHTLVLKGGKPMSDSARYRMTGNGVASCHSEWIGWRLMGAA